MGYLVAAHLAPPAVDVTALSALEPELAVRAYLLAAPPLTVLEVYKRWRKDPWPLTWSLDRYHLSPKVAEQQARFAKAVDALRERGYGVPGIHGELNLGLEISELLRCRVVSFVTSDEAEALLSICESGVIHRIRCLRDDLDIICQEDLVDVYPLDPGDEDPELRQELLARDVAEAFSAIEGIVVHSRDRPVSGLLHGMVIEELRAALAWQAPILGLGTWDPPEDLGLRLIASRAADGRIVQA